MHLYFIYNFKHCRRAWALGRQRQSKLWTRPVILQVYRRLGTTLSATKGLKSLQRTIQLRIFYRQILMILRT